MAPELLDMPTELLCLIYFFCRPDDAFSLAATCRRTYYALRSGLKVHSELWKRHNSLDLDRIQPLWDSLYPLLENPYLCNYVTSLALHNPLCLEDTDITLYNKDCSVKCILEPSDDLWDMINDAIGAAAANESPSTKFGGTLFDFYKHRFRTDERGLLYDVGSLAPLLLTILPELKILRIEINDHELSTYLKMLVLIEDVYCGEQGPKLLSKVEHVELEAPRPDLMSRSMSRLKSRYLFAALSPPRIRSIGAARMTDDLDWPWLNVKDKAETLMMRPPSYTLTRLEFQKCYFLWTSLGYILSKVPCLETLIYDGGGCTVDFHAARFAHVISKQCPQTLRNLTLQFDQTSPSTASIVPASFAGFVRLESLVLDICVLSPNRTSESPVNVIDLLPATLRYLKIFSVLESDFPALHEALNRKRSKLPLLQRMSLQIQQSLFGISNQESIDPLDAFKEAACLADVACRIRGYACKL